MAVQHCFGFAFQDERFSDRVLCLTFPGGQTSGNLAGLEDTGESKDGPLVCRRIPVNSLPLAAASPFFKTLLTNGMRETSEREITLQVLPFFFSLVQSVSFSSSLG